MLHDSSSNTDLDQGDKTTENTNDSTERDNGGGDTSEDSVQGIVESIENSCEKCKKNSERNDNHIKGSTNRGSSVEREIQ